jgi:hypothetical protein
MSEKNYLPLHGRKKVCLFMSYLHVYKKQFNDKTDLLQSFLIENGAVEKRFNHCSFY